MQAAGEGREAVVQLLLGQDDVKTNMRSENWLDCSDC